MSSPFKRGVRGEYQVLNRELLYVIWYPSKSIGNLVSWHPLYNITLRKKAGDRVNRGHPFKEAEIYIRSKHFRTKQIRICRIGRQKIEQKGGNIVV